MWRMRRTQLDRGAAAVEMALVMPVLLLLLFGMVDIGRLLYTKVELSSAARDGARILALGKSQSDVLTRAQASYSWAPVQLGTTQSCPNAANTATVEVKTQFTWITPVGAIAGFFGGSGMSGTQDVSSKGSMKCNL